MDPHSFLADPDPAAIQCGFGSSFKNFAKNYQIKYCSKGNYLLELVQNGKIRGKCIRKRVGGKRLKEKRGTRNEKRDAEGKKTFKYCFLENISEAVVAGTRGSGTELCI